MSEITLTKNNFSEEVLNYNGKVLVDFWAPWCAPCRMIAPIIEEISEELNGVIKVGKVNVDTEAELAISYRVEAIPTIAVFENGNLINRMAGFTSKENLIEMLDL